MPPLSPLTHKVRGDPNRKNKCSSAIEHESDLIENNLNKFRGNQLPAATKDLK